MTEDKPRMPQYRSMEKNDIGERVKQIRKEKGIQQGQMAKDLYMSRSTLSMQECGERPYRAEDIQKIATYFNVTTDELIFGVKPEHLEMNKMTGLNEEAIETLSEIHAHDESGRKADILSRLISDKRFLECLISYMDIEVKEEGYFESTSHTAGEEFYYVTMSPASYS